MNAKDIISAQLEGASFDRIFHAVRKGRESVSTLSEDKLEFFESMLEEIKKGTSQLEDALGRDDLVEIRRQAESLREIFQMIEGCCDEKS